MRSAAMPLPPSDFTNSVDALLRAAAPAGCSCSAITSLSQTEPLVDVQ